jgi:hypothetical protein
MMAYGQRKRLREITVVGSASVISTVSNKRRRNGRVATDLMENISLSLP